MNKRFKSFLAHSLPNRSAAVFTNPKHGCEMHIRNLDHRFAGGDTVYAVYQYGKSGSRTVYTMLKDPNRAVVHCHVLNPVTCTTIEHLACHPAIPPEVRSAHFRKNLRNRLYAARLNTETRPLKIVTTVRAPDAYLKSVFFQQQWFYEPFVRAQFGEYNADVLARYFEQCLSNVGPWLEAIKSGANSVTELMWSRDDIDVGYLAWLIHVYLTWFDDELGFMFGIKPDDIVEGDGYWTYTNNGTSGVILRVEDLDRIGKRVLTGFSGGSLADTRHQNVTSENRIGHLYQPFLEAVTIPRQILALVKSPWHARMFYPT